MWKIIVAFIIFAALAMYLLMSGGDIDMGGEKHSTAPLKPMSARMAMLQA